MCKKYQSSVPWRAALAFVLPAQACQATCSELHSQLPDDVEVEVEVETPGGVTFNC